MKHQQQERGIAHLGIVVLVVAAVAFGGWWVWEKQSINSPDTRQSENQEEVEQKSVAPEGWKFYKNSEAGFSFYYPPAWGEVKESTAGSLHFSEVSGGLLFQANRRDKEHTQGHFGVLQLNNAINVLMHDNDSATVTFLRGSNPNTREETFTGDEIIKVLPSSHACALDGVSVYEEYMNDPELINSYVYFGYCGLLSPTYGAVAFASDSLDITSPGTNQFREDITKLLETFETF